MGSQQREEAATDGERAEEVDADGVLGLLSERLRRGSLAMKRVLKGYVCISSKQNMVVIKKYIYVTSIVDT